MTLANAAGVTLRLNSFATQIGSLSGGGATGGDVTLGSATLTDVQTTTTTFVGVISGTGGLTLNGSGGNLTLSGANAYTGATTVNAGTLTAGVASIANTSGAFGDNSTVTLANVAGATLNLDFNTQIGSLSGGGATGGNVTLGSATLTDVQTTTTTFAGVISGSGGLTLNGSGNLTLSGANTYTGATTVDAGTLTAGVASVANTSGGSQQFGGDRGEHRRGHAGAEQLRHADRFPQRRRHGGR